MEFNDTTDKLGLIQDCEDLLGLNDTDISGDSNLLKRFTRKLNVAYRKVDSWIWESVNDWEFDDSNQTDRPIAKATLVDSQEDYSVPSTARDIYEIDIKDSAGNFVKLKNYDEADVSVAWSEFHENDGVPRYYRLSGQSIYLKPNPASGDVTLSEGLWIYYNRDISEFADDDTTKEPGFDNHFHRLLPLMASRDYTLAYMPEDTTKISRFEKEMEELKESLKKFYSGRHRDFHLKLKRNRPRII